MEGDHRDNRVQRPAEERQDQVDDETQELIDRTQELVVHPDTCVRLLDEIIADVVEELPEQIVQVELGMGARVAFRDQEVEIPAQVEVQAESQTLGQSEPLGESNLGSPDQKVETPAQVDPVQKDEVELLGQVEEQTSGPEPEALIPVVEPSGESNAIILDYLDVIRNINFEEILLSNFNETINAEPVCSKYDNIEELHDDLFNCDPSWALAHCVSSDLAMFRGIAVEFKKRFNNCQFLKNQKAKIGYVAVQNYFAQDDVARNGRFIIYLVTKELYNHRPTYFSIYCSLVRMRIVCEALNITKIAMPQIGSGCDRMDFRQVKHLIHTVFLDSNIEIRVYIK